MDSSDLQKYTKFIIDFLEPLTRVSDNSNNAYALLMELGYDSPAEVTAFHELGDIVKDLFDLVESVDELIESESTDTGKIAEILLELFVKIGKTIQHLKNFSNQIQQNFSGSDFLSDTDILSELPLKLVDYLFIIYLENELTNAYSILLFMDIIEETDVEANPPYVPAHKKRKINWNKIPDLFTDPVQSIKDIYIESDEIKFEKVIYLLEYIGVSLGVFSEVSLPDIDKLNSFNNTNLTSLSKFDDLRYLRLPLISDPLAVLALEIYPVINASNEKCEAVGVGINFGSELEIPVGDRFKLKISFSASLNNSLGFIIDKNGHFSFKGDVFTSPQNLADSISITFKAVFEAVENPLGQKFVSIGSSGGSRMEIGSGSFTLGVDKKGPDATVYVEVQLKDGLVVINLGGADSFIGSLMSGQDINSTFNLGIGFSNKGGIYITGGSLEIALPTHIQLGPIEIISLLLGLKIQNKDLSASIATSFNAQLGPLAASVENIGIKTDIKIRSDNSGNLGPFDLTPGFRPPNGLGLAINAGAVIGGGYLFFDFDKEEYAGVLELTIAGFISAKAIGLITTKMPDGSKGFSMLIIITAEFNPPFQLGYGFTLIGVGGLLGLNRTVLLDPLREGVRTGAVNSIMFPQNVVANAPKIISDLKTIFPPYEDKFLIGPMGKMGWGTPTLISLSLGLIIEIPGNLAILGVLKVALPDERVPIVLIQVAFVGTLDFDKKMLTFDASLYGSFILFMTLEGDMAVRLKWGENPNFILSIGGFHPQYTPPPLALPTLRRLAINILNTSVALIRVECYQAVTSNTVQFGAKAEIKFDLRVCSIEGYIAFDALFQFSPFYFIVAVAAGFALKVAGFDLLSVHIKMSLEGPTPWRAKGTGSISILFWDISADFDKTWGESKDTSLPKIDVMPKFIEEVNKPEQWTAEIGNSKSLVVSLRKFKETEGTELVLHPAGSLIVRQKLLPLSIQFDKIGNQTTNDIKKVDITAASSKDSLNNQVTLKVTHVDEDFARAQYLKLSDAEKLSKPSFEKMPGGVIVSLGDENIKNGKMVRKNVEYEITLIDKEPKKPLLLGLFFTQIAVLFLKFLKGNSVSKSVLSQNYKEQRQPFKEKTDVMQEGFTLVYQSNNKAYNESSTFTSEMQAHSYMQEQISNNPFLKKDLHIIPNYEVQ